MTKLEVKKNRFDGELGHVYMHFSPLTCCFYEDAEAERKILAVEKSNKSKTKGITALGGLAPQGGDSFVTPSLP